MKKKNKNGFWKKHTRALAAVIFGVGFVLGLISAPYLNEAYLGADSVSPDACSVGTIWTELGCQPDPNYNLYQAPPEPSCVAYVEADASCVPTGMYYECWGTECYQTASPTCSNIQSGGLCGQ